MSAPMTNAEDRGLGCLGVSPGSGNSLSAHGTERGTGRGARFPFCPWARGPSHRQSDFRVWTVNTRVRVSPCKPTGLEGELPAVALPHSCPAARLSQHLARSPAKTETGDSPGRATFIACDLCP